MAECERREKILSAAGEVLRTHGYQAASMDKVAQCSGMSKRTLYQLFPSKQELFHALIGARLFRLSLSVRENAGTPTEELIALLSDMAAHLTRPDTVELIRAIIASAPEAEDIRHIMSTLTQCGETNILKAWLQKYCCDRGLCHENTEEKSRQLFGMTVGDLMLDALISRNLEPDAVRSFITSGARLFLAALEAERNQEGRETA